MRERGGKRDREMKKEIALTKKDHPWEGYKWNNYFDAPKPNKTLPLRLIVYHIKIFKTFYSHSKTSNS